MRVLSNGAIVGLVAFSLGVATFSSAKAQPQGEVSETASQDEAAALWSFAETSPSLRLASCPAGGSEQPPNALAITVQPIDLGPADERARQLGMLTLAGAWQLEANHSGFGGLSGLAIMPSGALLSVSDKGAFITIGMDTAGGAPSGSGAISYMKAADGTRLSGKYEYDAEGLDYRGGLAFVSFEHAHRIEAFNLEGCGAAAVAARVAELPGRLAGERINANRGAEALTLIGDTLHVGYEQRIGGETLISVLGGDGRLSLQDRIQPADGHALTGMDHDEATGLTARLYRFYRSRLGNRIEITVDGPNTTYKGIIRPPLPVDNFEGVALGRAPSGAPRLWLIADDNFKPEDQRTLLFALDLPTLD